MIVYGSRMYGRKNLVKAWGYCENCDRYGKNQSYDGRKFGHLYFIPLIPMDGRMRVIMECKKCSHGLHIPIEEVADLKAQINASTIDALDALIAGEKTFHSDGELVSAISAITGSVGLLHSLQAKEHLQKICDKLRENKALLAYHMVEAEVMKIRGDLDAAMMALDKAHKADPNDGSPLQSQGALFAQKNDYHNAKSKYEQALKLLPEDEKFSVRAALLDVYEALKDFEKLSKTYESLFEQIPELKQDKSLYKKYQKACKKSGRQPVPKN